MRFKSALHEARSTAGDSKGPAILPPRHERCERHQGNSTSCHGAASRCWSCCGRGNVFRQQGPEVGIAHRTNVKQQVNEMSPSNTPPFGGAQKPQLADRQCFPARPGKQSILSRKGFPIQHFFSNRLLPRCFLFRSVCLPGPEQASDSDRS